MVNEMNCVFPQYDYEVVDMVIAIGYFVHVSELFPSIEHDMFIRRVDKIVIRKDDSVYYEVWLD